MSLLFNLQNIVMMPNIEKKHYFFSLIEQVLIPNGKYKGQKLTKLVSKKTAAKTTSTIPNIPETIPVK